MDGWITPSARCSRAVCPRRTTRAVVAEHQELRRVLDDLQRYHAGAFRGTDVRAWHDMIAHLMGVRATGDVNGGFHHHASGSKSGQVHNDLNPGWFVDTSDARAVNLSRNELCSYSNGATPDPDIRTHQTVRAVALLILPAQSAVAPGRRRRDRALQLAPDQPVHRPTKKVPPINNSLYVFECRPNSFHSFLCNRRGPRNSMIMWLHRPVEEAARALGPEGDRAVERSAEEPAHMNGVSRKVGLLTGAGGRLGEAFCRMFCAHYDIAAVIRNRPPSVPSQRAMDHRSARPRPAGRREPGRDVRHPRRPPRGSRPATASWTSRSRASVASTSCSTWPPCPAGRRCSRAIGYIGSSTSRWT